MTDLSRFTESARLLERMRQLEPGKAYRVYTRQLLDMEVPANPLDRQTPEFIAKFLYDRMPFPCELIGDRMGEWFEIYRPPHNSFP